MILAYPYFRHGDIFYYVYKKEGSRLSILAYDSKSEEFLNVMHRTVKDGKFIMNYRPVRKTFYMSDLVPVEE